MKKYVIFSLIIFLCSISGFGQSGIYQLSFQNIHNKELKMQPIAGKKIIVVISDISNPNKKQLLSLDSLYKKNQDKVSIIVIPVNDWDNGNSDKNKFKKLVLDTLKLSYNVTQISKAQKSNGANQQPLLKYLTDKTSNGHFDMDIQKGGEMFVISEKGNVFASIKESAAVSMALLQKIIDKKADK